MNVYLRMAFLILLSVFINSAYSREQLKAYIIKLNGDTIEGKIKIQHGILKKNVYELLRFRVNFQSDNEEKFNEYKPEDLKEFAYKEGDGNWLRYFSENLYKKQLFFLCLIIDGPVRLYHDYYIGTYQSSSGIVKPAPMTNIYIKKQESEILKIEDNWELRVKKRKPLKAYLADCPVIIQELSNPDELKIDMIVKKYNEWYLQNKK
ncbi:MAG: hypothetical protein ACM3H8_16305 [Sphingobacteriales bacterium]